MKNKFSLRKIQEEQGEWADSNFPFNPQYAGILGVSEEAGELSHHYLKYVQGIRGTDEEHFEGMKDAIGDITIYLLDVCNRFDWDYQSIIQFVWDGVKKRNWIEDPITGEHTLGKTKNFSLDKEINQLIEQEKQINKLGGSYMSKVSKNNKNKRKKSNKVEPVMIHKALKKEKKVKK